MSEQVISRKTYFLVFAALLVLLAATVGIREIDLGFGNIVAAMTIACIKALLVGLFFMHLRYSSKMVLVFAGAGLLWLVILIVLTFSDYLSR